MRRVLLLLAVGLAGCGSDGPGTPAPQASPRTYVMGFTAIPPRPDTALAIRTVDLWATRADAGLLLYDPPWERLLAGDDAETLVRANELGLANYYRGKGLRLVASIDATDGLDRAADSPALRALAGASRSRWSATRTCATWRRSPRLSGPST